ncbi:NAD(P)/FAD-dependent oxidoreductase [Nonlabens ponticola]|uniref:NADH:ubiquinone reductase (non-electrogenic) n=1 Tax=Nonlabens ponticola TaxID=2496866 RepID=A0A3S9MZM1_9FLAO|nr:NAD(P)/FAD-dependent oxidoreductase [Nonlabens ponticola]AZQ44716.1 NAD(P)/FAD-dependent oxidoreductase [Nonlabens ponticola]
MHIPASDYPRIVIVGGGFGGVTLSRKLTQHKYQVVLIDRHNYHTFQPLLYQVATSGLEPDSIAFPLRSVPDENDHYIFRMAEVEAVDQKSNTISTSIGAIHYDHLILATGTKTNFFGNEKIERNALSMKSVPESLDIRSLMLQNLEKATITDNEKEQRKLMRIVMSGAGPTGVELSGAFAEFKKGILSSDYPDLNPDWMEIILLDGSDRVLSSMSEKASKKAEKYLKELGVTVMLDEMVIDYEDDVVSTKSGKEIDTATFIWSAGVTGNAPDGFSDDQLSEKGGRLLVDLFNKVKGTDNVYAVGDIALMKTDDYPDGHPQVAQPAIQQAQNVASNFARISKGKEPKPFSYFDKGSMATVGRNRAVADIKGFTLGGFWAWFAWLGVHLYFLVGVRNRIVVFLNWIYNYFNFDRAARLIIRPYKKETTAQAVSEITD